MAGLRAGRVRTAKGNGGDRQCEADKQGKCNILEPGKVLGFHAATFAATWNGWSQPQVPGHPPSLKP